MRADKKSFDLNFNSLSLNIINLLLAKTGYFTLIVGSEAGVDLVLIHTQSLLYIKFSVMLTSIFQGQFPLQSQGNFYQNIRSPSASHSLEGQGSKSTTVKWSIKMAKLIPVFKAGVPEIFINQWPYFILNEFLEICLQGVYMHNRISTDVERLEIL